MNCPECGGQTRVSNTEINDSGLRIRRFRNCKSCGYRFRTTQTVEKLDNDGSSFNFAQTRNRGEDHGKSVFNDEDIKRMRKMHESGGYTWTALGKIFGCTRQNVKQICTWNTWKHVL